MMIDLAEQKCPLKEHAKAFHVSSASFFQLISNNCCSSASNLVLNSMFACQKPATCVNLSLSNPLHSWPCLT